MLGDQRQKTGLFGLSGVVSIDEAGLSSPAPPTHPTAKSHLSLSKKEMLNPNFLSHRTESNACAFMVWVKKAEVREGSWHTVLGYFKGMQWTDKG